MGAGEPLERCCVGPDRQTGSLDQHPHAELCFVDINHLKMLFRPWLPSSFLPTPPDCVPQARGAQSKPQSMMSRTVLLPLSREGLRQHHHRLRHNPCLEHREGPTPMPSSQARLHHHSQGRQEESGAIATCRCGHGFVGWACRLQVPGCATPGMLLPRHARGARDTTAAHDSHRSAPRTTHRPRRRS